MNREERLIYKIGLLYLKYVVFKPYSNTNFQKFERAMNRLLRKYNALRASSSSAESEV